MIGIVVVSHSGELAKAASDLALAVADGPRPKVAIAAGDAHGGFGTSAKAIVAAIRLVAGADGVLVIVDLGSAVLNAEMALDLLGPTDYPVKISAAPFLEGLVVAGATASAGGTLEEIEAEACRAGAGKADNFGPSSHAELRWATWDDSTSFTATTRLAGEHGLHARPTVHIVATVRGFDARVRLRNVSTGSRFVDASSFSAVLELGATQGDVLIVEACGNDARAAVARLVEQLSNSSTIPGPPTLRGSVGASPGVAAGVAQRWQRSQPNWSAGPNRSDSPERELLLLTTSVTAVRRELTSLQHRLALSVGEADASILESWRCLLEDRVLLDPIDARIRKGEPALRSWLAGMAELIERVRGLSDPYLRQRATDLADIRDRVAAELVGVQTAIVLTTAGIVVADELTVAEVAQLDPMICLGVVTSFGSPASHASILARSLGIPLVVGAPIELLDAMVGRMVVIDGSTGTVIVEPTQLQIAQAMARPRTAITSGVTAASRAETTDGTLISVAANIGSLHEAALAVSVHSDGVGLLRTEFMFSQCRDAPTEHEQYLAYAGVARALNGQTLTIRTFDNASDKPLAFLGGALSTGLRGLKLSLAYPEVLLDQLRAIARVAVQWPVRILLPYVLSASDVRATKALLLHAITPTDADAFASGTRIQLGAMIERPDTTHDIAAVAAEVDFLSVGTNDLAAAVIGANRSFTPGSNSASALDPTVLRLIHRVASERPELSVSVCGELAAELDAVPILIGLGIDQLSVRPACVADVRQEVRRWSLDEARSLALRALELADSQQVAALVQAHRPVTQPTRV